jgi:hypothetical protein
VRLRGAVKAGIAMALLGGATAQAATPELSTSDRLQDRREVASGTRAYSVGFQDGGFYANGWHITGEMGGVWTPPLKLVDGVWFGVGDQWVGPATRFSSGYGYTRYDLPSIDGLRLQRTDFAPNGRRGVLFGLTLTNPGSADVTTTVKVDAHSELLSAYPWSFAGTTPNAAENLPDTATYDADAGALAFRDQGRLSKSPRHDYRALVASNRTPIAGETGDGYRGPRPGTVCTGEGDAQPMPSACDDGPFGRGKGGELRYRVTVPAGGSQDVWIAVAGSEQGEVPARSELAKLLRDPAGRLAAKIADRDRLAGYSQVSLPGDPLLARAVDWGKQNLADLTQTAKDLHVRWTNQGKQFPAPAGIVRSATWIGAGFPDYPWIFATDAEYTAFANVALGQFRPIQQHMRALRDVSDLLNERSGLVAHEVVSDGSVWFGHDSVTTRDDGTRVNDFNTDETVKFPSTVALIWRWTGDDAFRDEMYDFAKRNLQYVQTRLDEDGDGWLEGSGNVELSGMGPEKLDNAVYYIRGLYDLADMADSKGDTETVRWARRAAQDLQSRFESTWWYPSARQYADSLTEDDQQLFQKHWIGQTPMEAELHVRGRTVPGLASRAHGRAALAERESSTYSGDRPGSRGMFHTGRGGGADGQGVLQIFSLNTAIQAVGEGNYGRLGPDQQRRYTDANAETMFSEPATGGTPDEQPGAMPEIFPSEGFSLGGNISRCFTCRSMFMQAWGHYGTAWPVIHQQLGVRPDLGRGAVEVVPQVPAGQPSVQGQNIRLGDGAIGVLAARDGRTYTTTVNARRTPGDTLTIGATVPADSEVRQVRLDGRRVTDYEVRATNRGLEVTVAAAAGAQHTVRVVAP